MFGYWFRSRRALIGELVEAREQAAVEAREAELAAKERDRYVDELRKERRAHAATQGLLEAFEGDGVGDVFGPTVPRTAAEELVEARRHAAELEERVHLLQMANMARDRR